MLDKKLCGDKSDTEIVYLALHNTEYFLCIVQRYEAALLRFLRRITNFREEDLEDLLQEVFIKVYKNLNGYNKNMKFSSWIYRITRNEAISQHRKNQVRPQTVFSELNDEFMENLRGEFDLEKEMDDRFNKNNVVGLLNKLDDKYKEVLMLRFLEDKSYEEIGDILQKSSGTVGSLISRAKDRFKQEYKK